MLEFKLKHCAGLWKTSEVFYDPIVQQRIGKGDFLDAKIKRLRDEREYVEMERLIEGAFLAMDGLASRGIFVHDNQSGNFCIIGGKVYLSDVGAIWKVGKHVMGALDADTAKREEYVARNLYTWMQVIMGDASKGEFPDLDRISKTFIRKFNEYNTWGHVNRLCLASKKMKGKAIQVPDVFPLTVNPK